MDYVFSIYITETGSDDTLKIQKEHYYVLKFAHFLRGFPAWLDLGSLMQVQTLRLVLSEPGSDWCQSFSSKRPRYSNCSCEQ